MGLLDKFRFPKRVKHTSATTPTGTTMGDPPGDPLTSSHVNPTALTVEVKLDVGNLPCPVDLEITRRLLEIKLNDLDSQLISGGHHQSVSNEAGSRNINEFTGLDDENDDGGDEVVFRQPIPKAFMDSDAVIGQRNQMKASSSVSSSATSAARQRSSKRYRLRNRGSRTLASVKRFVTTRRLRGDASQSNEKKQIHSSQAKPLRKTNMPGSQKQFPDDLNGQLNSQEHIAQFCSLYSLHQDWGDASRRVSDETNVSLDPGTSINTVCQRTEKHSDEPISMAHNCLGLSTPQGQPEVYTYGREEPEDCGAEQHNQARTSSSVYSTDFDFQHPQRSTRYSSSYLMSWMSNEATFSIATSSQFYSSMSSDHSSFRQQVALEFNNIGAEVKLLPLIVNESSVASADSAAELLTETGEASNRHKDSILRRIRSMRSMRSSLRLLRSRINRRPALRRTKSSDDTANRYYRMDSLKGKSLEMLANLGGCSFLTFPADFAPATLKLPVCFVATISYLKTHGLNTRYLFFDAGDLGVAVRIYNHFAEQFRSAKRRKEKIDFTIRGSELPRELLNFTPDSSLDGQNRALSVGCVFMRLLSGIPGGILGSRQLLRTLVDIESKSFEHYELEEKRDSLLTGVSSTAYVRIKAIALAILALATDMQLDLICAVFGLCSLIMYETEREIALQCQKKGSRIGVVARTSASMLYHLGRVFGPLLASSHGSLILETASDTEEEEQKFQVMIMMVKYWRGVSRQLRVWETYGFPVAEQVPIGSKEDDRRPADF